MRRGREGEDGCWGVCLFGAGVREGWEVCVGECVCVLVCVSCVCVCVLVCGWCVCGVCGVWVVCVVCVCVVWLVCVCGWVVCVWCGWCVCSVVGVCEYRTDPETFNCSH